MPNYVCPHCGCAMDPIETPYESSWGGEIHYVCFNDNCGYFTRSWEALIMQGVEGAGYRCRMDPRGSCGPIPVSSPDDLRDMIVRSEEAVKGTSDFFSVDEFSRDDETPDDVFYGKPRIVDHLDSLALATVEDLYARLIPEGSRILDLMAGPDSHLKGELKPSAVIGLGLNQEELDANPALTKRIIHDLNATPQLPLADDQFEAVVNTVSVDYMTKPVEVFRDVARILKKEGVFIVVFSNRMFPPKAVKLWKHSTESERIELVKKYFCAADQFYLDGYFESKGHPRPEDDKYYSFGIPSDPIYAVWGKVVK